VSVEGSSLYYPSYNGDLPLPAFDPLNKQSYYIDLFQRGDKPVSYEISKGAEWIKFQSQKVSLLKAKDYLLKLIGLKHPRGKTLV
jgi:hypothetical protein